MVTILPLLFAVLAVCSGTPITEDQLRSLIQPILDANQSPKATPDSPQLLASLAASTPLSQLTEQLRSLIQPILDANQNPKATPDSPPLFASFAANTPLSSLVIDTPQNAQPNQMTGQISPANQMAQLNLLNPLTNLVKNAIGSLRPQPGPVAPVDPLIGGMFPNGGVVQPAPAPVQPQRRMNMFNPLSFLFPGSGGGSPFGMMMPSLMMRMMERLFELF